MEKKGVVSMSEYQYAYTKKDYLESEAPYAELWKIQNPFLQGQAVSRMEVHAKSVGVKNFKSLWQEYRKKRTRSA